MKEIQLVSAVASAPTELGAFDKALSRMGMADMNLLHLSSVIPDGCTVVKKDIVTLHDGMHGDRCYVVYADMRVSTVGETAAAGLGWVCTTKDPSWGLFVEHVGNSEESVREQIRASLTSMVSYRTECPWNEIQYATVSIPCTNEPVCAMALAFYKNERW